VALASSSARRDWICSLIRRVLPYRAHPPRSSDGGGVDATVPHFKLFSDSRDFPSSRTTSTVQSLRALSERWGRQKGCEAPHRCFSISLSSVRVRRCRFFFGTLPTPPTPASASSSSSPPPPPPPSKGCPQHSLTAGGGGRASGVARRSLLLRYPRLPNSKVHTDKASAPAQRHETAPSAAPRPHAPPPTERPPLPPNLVCPHGALTHPPFPQAPPHTPQPRVAPAVRWPPHWNSPLVVVGVVVRVAVAVQVILRPVLDPAQRVQDRQV
jgi:hypothetical protein